MKHTENLIRLFPTVQNARVSDIFDKFRNISISGSGNYSAKAFLFSDVVRHRDDIKTAIWVVNDAIEQENVAKALRFWGGLEVFTYAQTPADINRSREVEAENRLKAMEFICMLNNRRRKVVVVPYIDLMGTFPQYTTIREKTMTLKVDEEVNMTSLFEDLIERGYEVSDDKILAKGTYYKSGEVLNIFPLNYERPIKIEIGFEKIERITEYDPLGDFAEDRKSVEIVPARLEGAGKSISAGFNRDFLVIEDELDVIDEFYENWANLMDESYEKINSLLFVSFNEDEEHHRHMHFVSVLKYRGSYDFANDMKDKGRDGWRVMVFTKDPAEIKGILDSHNLSYHEELESGSLPAAGIILFEMDKEDVLPGSFQNPEMKIAVLTDREISSIKEEKKRATSQKVFLDFLTSLKVNDYVVHVHHGIGKFMGLEKRTVDDVTREYLKVAYAENDKLFVPIDQADKVNKFIGADEAPPKLTRLGSAEWDTITRKVQKETEIIAKELLQLYAERKAAKGFAYKTDTEIQRQFEEAFPYEETPGQLKATADAKKDMEMPMPMDRLVCGDVGFGKTEVAMRAAFKAVQSKKQVALISPITILADQHYRSLVKRMEDFDVRVDLLSRFRTHKQQEETVKKLEKGEVDVVVGTHRLLQKDVKFKDLGLVIIDEEQRFGVKQKEALKQLKKEVDVLTLTATPIPRTLNIALNKLRDISTITTPPPGRLPIITEVRRYSMGLIREAILREIERGGQIYFLHNRVQTIDAMAEKLRILVPEARFEVAHGKLGSGDLEERILAFKDHKFDVLVSSTIIENGIDLANANTLIVNNAERFGLAQLYQLRGRVGRGKTQAYAFFLYHGQRLKLDAKKRLRAIVEATELGSGFQIAMKDLEIRGAGDILGAKQHGVINVVGVSHFIRMLNKAVDDLKAGKVMRAEEPEEVQIELPISAYIPDTYIPNSKDKINEYQKMSAADNMDYLNEIKEDMIEDYGKLPVEVINLFNVIELKILAKAAKLVSVKAEAIGLNKGREIALHMSSLVKPENIANLLEYNDKWYISGTRMRIRVEGLGMHWMDGLKEGLRKLGGSIRDTHPAMK